MLHNPEASMSRLLESESPVPAFAMWELPAGMHLLLEPTNTHDGPLRMESFGTAGIGVLLSILAMSTTPGMLTTSEAY